MSQSGDNVKLLGACVVSINGVDVGHTDLEGVVATLSPEIVRAYANKFGKLSGVKAFVASMGIKVKFNLLETVFSAIASALPGATIVTSGGNSKLTFGLLAGTKMTPVTLLLTPMLSDESQATKYPLQIVAAIPVGEFMVTYKGDTVQVWNCEWEGLINEASGANGSYLATFGDPAISADSTPPTVSSSSPSDGGALGAVTGNISTTFSEALDPNYVDTDSVKLYKEIGPGTGHTPVAIAVTLQNGGTEIVIDPTASLDAASTYLVVITSAVRDLAGNRLATDHTREITTP